MINIILQKNRSENNRVIKNTVDIATLTGTLRDSSSIIKPVVLISGDLNSFKNANYATIPAFNRKYFIEDIISIRAGLVQIVCRVDVLSSFANEIRSNTAIIQRQESEFNLYLNDGSFRVYQNPQIVTKSFPGGFASRPEYVLAVAG